MWIIVLISLATGQVVDQVSATNVWMGGPKVNGPFRIAPGVVPGVLEMADCNKISGSVAAQYNLTHGNKDPVRAVCRKW